jgi:hypothetical protein
MFSIKPNQFAEMAATIRKDYLLVIVSDFFALFEQCYQRPSRLDFEAAWRIADYLFDQLQGKLCPEGERIEYEFIHTVLCAAEKEQRRSNCAKASQFSVLHCHRMRLDSFCSIVFAHWSQKTNLRMVDYHE